MDGVHPVTGEVYAVPIGKLAEALATAQGEIKCALMDSENPAYKREGEVSKYADLAAVWAACREALSKNKLAVIQTTHRDGDGWVLRTTLAHASSESVSGDFPLRPMKPDMQGFMAAVTYARRSGLAAICGVAPRGDDDDGNEAAGVKTNGQTTQANGKAAEQKAPPAESVPHKPAGSRVAVPTPAVQKRVKPQCDARYDEIWGVRNVDSLLSMEQDAEFKKQMEWLHANWPEQYNRLRTAFKEQESKLMPQAAE